MKLLFVENHARFARIVQQEFLAAHEVVAVTSIAAAQAAIVAQTFDALLVDFDLDDGKGTEVVGFARTHHPTLPIIATSSHWSGNEALLSAGADHVCDKLHFHHISQLLASLPQSEQSTE